MGRTVKQEERERCRETEMERVRKSERQKERERKRGKDREIEKERDKERRVERERAVKPKSQCIVHEAETLEGNTSECRRDITQMGL